MLLENKISDLENPYILSVSSACCNCRKVQIRWTSDFFLCGSHDLHEKLMGKVTPTSHVVDLAQETEAAVSSTRIFKE